MVQGPLSHRVAFTLVGSRVWTGGYNYLLNLARAIHACTNSSFRPVLFAGEDVTPEDIAPFQHIDRLEVVRSAAFDRRLGPCELASLAAFGENRAASRVFRRHAIDVVLETGRFFGWRLPLPTIAWFPDFQHRHFPQYFGTARFLKREIGFRTQVWSGRFIMVSSDDARKDCERFYPASHGRIGTVRFAILPTPETTAASPAETMTTYGLVGDFFYAPNQFWRHKNHAVLIEAVHILKKQRREVVVVMSGAVAGADSESYYKMLRVRVAEAGLSENVRFLGMVPYEHVIGLLRACVALINPSLFEGWSTTVEEARAFGTPMLLSRLPVHLEQAEEAAHFFDPMSPQELASLMAERVLTGGADGRGNVASAQAARVRRFVADLSGLIDRAVSSTR